MSDVHINLFRLARRSWRGFAAIASQINLKG